MIKVNRMDLENFRKEIDAINEEVIALLGKRMHVAKKIAAYKKTHALPVYDAEREKEEKEKIQYLAKKYNLNPEFTAKLFSLFIEYTRLEMSFEMGLDT